MRLPPLLDRLWTYTVWAAYCFIVPIWLILWWERVPALAVLQAVLIVWFLASHARSELRRGTRRDASDRPTDTSGIP